ncbi:RNA polymerase recycling motor HelD [Bacillus sp. 165]|uniref:RNA polymerase recycling motor HelD n=1 Tax=Bacillus sp. 165 TaxID=1529117 RepID=UPI001ADC3C40|nr:RNA polymerase recycling motor HelD [Bacillus sp. 165]MBO9129013.1 AAA family ATPase [Bacillus sp. 165]
MTAFQHPEYAFEKERLEFTKSYMSLLLAAAKENEQKYQEHLRSAFSSLTPGDSSADYINLLLNAKFLEMTEREHRHLERLQGKPYFARIDFQDTTQQEPHIYYIGKMSLYDKDTQKDIIVDWRSPIANVYYDGRLGEVSYEVEGDTIIGDLSLKRQYAIEEGELQDIRDIDITTKDELLQEALSGNAQNRLMDIVSTIQEEQNRVIRADLYRPLIVQGVAGSGKTTIALHRIAYFIYTHAQSFSPDAIMILAPSKLFLTYIAEVLPELGVDQVNQTTFLEFVNECLKKPVVFSRMEEALVAFIHEKDEEKKKEMERVISFKGSLQYLKLLHRYAKDIEKHLLPKEDFKIGGLTVYKEEKLRRLFLYDYKYLPPFQRIDKLKRVLANHVKSKKATLEKRITDYYDNKIDRAIYRIDDPAKRKEKVIALMDKKLEMLEGFKKDCKTAVSQYIRKFSKKDVFDYYDELITNKELLKAYGMKGLSQSIINGIVASKQKRKHRYKVEDAAALLYLQYYLYGPKNPVKTRCVVIDEAQDYTIFELYALKKVCNTELFTILGDMSQGIHGYRGMKQWEPLVQNVFPKGNYLTLESSYRTTIEIMNLANEVLKNNCNVQVPLAVPVVRHGSLPQFMRYAETAELLQSIEDFIEEGKQQKLKSFALLGKTKEECEALYDLISELSLLPVRLITEQQELDHSYVSIIPIHIAKGLEFDCVGIVSYEETYGTDELDVKLVYVGMTRPLHRLGIFAKDKKDVLLEGLDEALLQ